MASVVDQRRTLLISPSPIADDPRVLAHLDVLSSCTEVVTCGHGRKPQLAKLHIEVPSELSYVPIRKFSRIRYVPKNPTDVLKLLLRCGDPLKRITEFSRFVIAELDQLKFDLVCANDVYSIVPGFQIARKSSCPIWIDMHEYAPLESEDDWKWRLILQPYVKKIISTSLPKANAVSSVGVAICERYERELGRSVELIRNTSPYRKTEVSKRRVPKKHGQFRLVHVGSALPGRKLENMIAAVKLLENITLDLLLVPTNDAYYRWLKVLSCSTANVRIVPPVRLEEVVQYLSSYDAGVIMIPPTNYNYANGLPNKLFQYIQARIPVITGPTPEIASLVRRYRNGWVSSSFDVPALTLAVLDAVKNRDHVSVDDLDRVASEVSREIDDEVRFRLIQQLLEPG